LSKTPNPRAILRTCVLAKNHFGLVLKGPAK
jgi:hypothetical protein